MNQTTIKQIIIKYLEENYGDKWCFGGALARAIHDITGTKESVVERRARELVQSGVLEKQLVQVDGEGPRVVMYSLHKEIPPLVSPVIENKQACLL